MKKKPGFWIIIGAAICIATLISTHNIPGSLCIGAGGSLLLMIVTNMEVDQKNRN